MGSFSYLWDNGLPWWLRGKEPACPYRRCRSDPWVKRYPEGGNGNLLQYSFLENSMDRGAWWARVQTVAKGQTLTEHAHTHTTSNGFAV